MLRKISGILLFSLCLIACYMNYADRIAYSPQPPDRACNIMATVLENLGYKVTEKNEAPNVLITSKPYIWAEKSFKEPEGKIKATIGFARIQGETRASIHLDWIGKSQIKDQILKDATAEISVAFEAASK